MKLTIIAFIIFIITLRGFSQTNKMFELIGQTENQFDGYLYLKYNNKIDSALVKSKSFYFKGKIDYPTEALLITRNGTSAGIPIFLENSKTSIKVEIDNNVTIINSIEGNETFNVMSDLQDYYQSIESDSEFVSKIYNKIDKIITENPKSQFSGMILSDIILDPIFSYEQAFSLFNKLDLTTQDKEYLNSINLSLLKLKNQKIGTIVKDFQFPNDNGELINTSDFKTNFLLIEFWASWCGPCRKSNPELVKIYGDYNKKGFEIYGVSLDIKKESWIKAIKDDKLNWTNTIALDGFNNDIIKSLGIQSLPSNLLLDKNRRILVINIKPVELEKYLKNE